MSDRLSERDLLVLLCDFLAKKQIVVGDKQSILDMTSRYQSPPFTMAYPACIRLTMQDTNILNEILKQAHALLEAAALVKETP